jgi:hypothetical protein
MKINNQLTQKQLQPYPVQITMSRKGKIVFITFGEVAKLPTSTRREHFAFLQHGYK